MDILFYHLNLSNPIINSSSVKCMYINELDELSSSNIIV